jgi:radical SAM-linked protein
VRLRFTEHGKVRFISHRDVARAFERAFRITRLPLAFTAGFAPRPKVSFGLALSVGHESDAEYLDVELRETIDPDTLVGPLTEALPEGIDVTGAAALADRAPALQEAITALDYRLVPNDARDEPLPRRALQALVEASAASPELPATQVRKGQERIVDVKPVIRKLELAHGADAPVLELSLSTQPRGARPREVLDALAAVTGVDLVEGRVVRTAQWIERDGARWEPLAADALTRTLEACAS